MYILDSDILIWMLRNNKNIIDQISKLEENSPLAISVISIGELYKNVFPAEVERTEQFIEQHVIFDIDAKIAKMAGLYWNQYHKNLRDLSLTDCIVAATANIHDLTLVTLNKRHFPMKDIHIINPLV